MIRLRSEELLGVISRRLSTGTGVMSFAEFMEIALYWPGLGYYTRETSDIGFQGDFLTCPSCHPVFAKLLARQLIRMWRMMGRPREFTIVEVGGGGGDMAEGILSAWEAVEAAELGGRVSRARLCYTIVEKSETLRRKQARRLSGIQTRYELRWHDSLKSISDSSIIGVIVANELFTALPFHIVENTDEGPKEVKIKLEDGRIVEVLGELSSPDLREAVQEISREPGLLPVGCRTEVCLQAKGVMREFARILDKGFIITIDYGGRKEELAGNRAPFGTLRCYFGHQMNRNPYERIGRQDITADLDFDVLIEEGDEVGLKKLAYLEQWEFLMGLGILDEISGLEERVREDPSVDFELSPVIDLFSPASRGSLFKVLVQSKGLRVRRLDGFGFPSNLTELATRGGPISRAVIQSILASGRMSRR